MHDILSIIIICTIIFLMTMMVVIFFGGKSKAVNGPAKKERKGSNADPAGESEVKVEYGGDYAVSINDEQIEITAEEEFDPWTDYEPANAVEESIAPIEGTYDKNYWEKWDRQAFSQKNASEGIDEGGEGQPAAEGTDGNGEVEPETAEWKRYGVFKEDYELVPFGDDNIIDY